jgi:hypothetical protein
MAEFEEHEAAGDNAWTTAFSDPATVRLELLVESWLRRAPPDGTAFSKERARRINDVLRASGVRITDSYIGHSVALIGAIQNREDDLFPSIIEATIDVIRAEQFEESVKKILEQERIAYRLVDRRLIPFDTLELHESVVAPTLRLLVGRHDLADVEEGYQSALKEIGANPADAITDAARALQAMLTAIGCQGNSIGAQLTFARKKGTLANHDATLGGGIEKFIHWIDADRSEKGDAHQSANVTVEDAWFAVHVVGALIVRLSEGPRVYEAAEGVP